MKKIIGIVLALVLLVGTLANADLMVSAETSGINNIVGSDSAEKYLFSYENKADNFNYINYLAQHYTSGQAKETIEFRIDEATNCNNLVEYLENNVGFNTAYSEWVLASLIMNPTDTFAQGIHAETYYEAVILDILDSTVTSENAIDWLNQGAIKNSVKILKDMTKYAETDYYWYLRDKHILISDLTTEEKKGIEDFTKAYVKTKNYKVIGTDVSFLADVLSMSKDIEEYAEKLASYCQLMELGDEIASFLEVLKNNTDKRYLIRAIDNITPIIRDSYESMLITAAKDGIECIGKTAIKKIVGDAWKKSLIKLLNGGVLFDGKAIVDGSFLALSIGKTITNIAFSVDKKMDQYELMRALCVFEEAMEKSISDIINNYQVDEEYSNMVLAGVSIVYNTYITDTELYTEMVKICQSDWVGNLKEEEFNKVLEISNHNKQIYQQEYDSLKINSGICGNVVGWVITSNNELIVYGVGATTDYQNTTSPWYAKRDSIGSIYVSSHISTIGAFSFKDLHNVCQPIYLENDITINSNAFENVAVNITCTGNATLSGEHLITHSLHVLGDLSCPRGNLRVDGTINVDGKFKSDSLTNIYNYGYITVKGDADFVAAVHGLDDSFSNICIYEGATFLVGGNLDLKGSWYSNVATNWFLLNIYGELIVDGNFSASERFVSINQTTKNSSFKVNGDFYLNVLNANYVAGFDVGCKGYECVFTAGNLYIGGNYSNESTVTFKGSHTIILNGTEGQTVKNLSACNLDIANPSATGVDFSGISYITGLLNTNTSKLTNGSNLHVNGGRIISNTLYGDISLRGNFEFTNDLTISGNVYAVNTVATNITVPSKVKITIEGNAYFNAKNAEITVVIQEGGRLNVLGNISLQGKDSNPAFYNSIMSINGELLVGGNLTCTSCYSFNQFRENSFTSISGDLTFEENGWFYSYKNITAGIIEVKGKVHNYEASGNNVLVLKGTKTQQVSADYVYTHKFGTVASTVVIENTKGVNFTSQLATSTLFNHNRNSFTLYNNGANSSFVDYDGDGIKDNLDSHPTIHESCISGHNYGEWKIQTKPTPNCNGIQYKICTQCGDKNEEILPAITQLSFTGAALTLEDDLVINFKVDESLFSKVGYTNPYVVFNLNNEETIVVDFVQQNGKYIFDFKDIIPHQMNDAIYATLYATYDGVEYASEVREYSVATYCYNMLEKYNTDDYAKLRTLLVDLLNYGAASQVYMNYNIEELVNSSLTEEQKAWGSSTDRTLETVQELEYKTIDNPTVQWKSGGLNLQKSVGMRFKISAENIENLTVKVTNDIGKETIITSEQFEVVEGGYYVFFEGLNAGQMSDIVYLTVYNGETAVSNTIRYSIESYAYAQQNSTDANLAELVKAMMKYGDSAKAYIS